MGLAVSATDALVRKYEQIREMRRAHEDGTEGDPRELMRALAAEFPGALRELDELPMQTIEARLEALRAPQPPAWADTMSRYHGWMRLALAIKRAHGRDAEPAEVLLWLADRDTRPDEPNDVTIEAVRAILRPPTGRLSRWVLERVAQDTARELVAVEEDVFKCLKKR